MDTMGRGLIAGFLATLALSILIDPVAVLVRTAWPACSSLSGWLFHFFVGTVVWGVGFGFAHDHLRGPSWMRGSIFGCGAWVLMVAGLTSGMFGIRIGLTASAVTLVLHLVYGAMLGGIYGVLRGTPPSEASHDQDMQPLTH
ncbi:MAG TPA: DUF6789 family protein [Xanthobacteraceae bacterium]|nr:DUF6789 family protein [Xanthobacteraceae bacterium]